MKLEWKIGENVYLQELDMKLLSRNKEVSVDAESWLGMNLLDVEAFRQYKKSVALQDDKEIEHYFQIKKQYEKIDIIIHEAFVDAALIHDMYMEENTVFEREFADLINQLAPYLHSRRPLPMDIIIVPTSERADINQLLNRIRLALSSDIRTVYFEGTDVHWNRRSEYTMQKNIIRESIVRIAEVYSEESKKRYNTLYVLCKRNDIRGIYSYDFARVAVCASATQDYITDIEDGISTRTRLAFENRLDIQDFQTGLSIAKINKIDKYFSERTSIRKGNLHYDEMSGKLRRYFGRNRRCVAIMEFPDNATENMFALSGIELNDDKTYNTYFETGIATPIAQELNLDGTYIFCRQNVLMRRYTHQTNDTFNKLSQWNYLEDDIDWKANQMDYSCCERKFIAKLEMDNQSGTPFPRNIKLWTRLPICDNCDYAITDYENNYRAVIRIVN